MSKHVLTINLRCARSCPDGGQPVSTGPAAVDEPMAAELVGVLDLMDERDARATVFVCAGLARNCPDRIKAIAGRGHEIGVLHCGNHGMPGPSTKWNLPRIGQARESLQRLTGQTVDGFRDGFYSLSRDDDDHWSLLAEAGFRYDSSVLPYEQSSSRQLPLPRYPFRMLVGGRDVLEWPIATARLFGRLFPIACEPYVESLPYWLLRRSLDSFHTAGWPAVVAIGSRLRSSGAPNEDNDPSRGIRATRGSIGHIRQSLMDFQFETLNAATSLLQIRELTTLRANPRSPVQTDTSVARN